MNQHPEIFDSQARFPTYVLVMTKTTVYLSLSLQSSKDFSYGCDPVITSHQHSWEHGANPAGTQGKPSEHSPKNVGLLRASTNTASKGKQLSQRSSYGD